MKKLLYAVTSICLMTGIIFCNNVNTEAKVINNKIVYAKNNENAHDNLVDGVKSEVQGLQEERQKYLESLGLE